MTQLDRRNSGVWVDKAGRLRFGKLVNHIAKAKSKAHVDFVEKEALKRVQATKLSSTATANAKNKGRQVQDFEEDEDVKTSFLGICSGNEAESDGELSECDETYRAPRPPKKKKKGDDDQETGGGNK